ncbi:MAG: hypothetical protein IKL65_05535 [Bacilli bacterium]|nr:hypothetical protein [Bacilli bacterium]
MIAPNTDIYLLKLPIEIDETNQLIFVSYNDQYNYFHNLPRLELENATYQRKDNVLRYPTTNISFDDLLSYNYCMYRNESYSDKWFYAFIKNMRYINDGMCEIELETDVWQTWGFQISYKKCFIEREHVSDDTFGKHTVPENLETGEYMYQPVNGGRDTNWNDIVKNCRIVFAMSDPGHYGSFYDPPSGSRLYNGVFSGLRYFIMKDGDSAYWYIQDLMHMAGNKIEGLYAIFMAPDSLLGVNDSTVWNMDSYVDDGTVHYFYLKQLEYSNKFTYLQNCFVIDSRKCGENYVPKNNKVLCFPYRYITVSNNAGQTNQYRYEYFGNNNKKNGYYCDFGIHGAISIGCSIKLYPYLYNNPGTVQESDNKNYLEGIDFYKLPTCGWLTDPFLNWLSQNAVNIGISTASSALSIVAGTGMLATPATAGLGVASIGAGIASIAQTVTEGYKKSLEPMTAQGGQSQGDLNFANKRGFTPYCMSIRDEYAKIIDDYFTMFGYKVNSLKNVELHSRKNWNYIKTLNCNFVGDIPQQDLQKIRRIFDNGVTFWHNANTFLDYSQPNYIV